MELASAVHSSLPGAGHPAVSMARAGEIASQLRTAIMEGDDARLARLLSDLLRVRGLTRGQRVRLQSRALMNLVHSLRSAALNDDVTGLLNRRGFIQTATRLLDLALRDRQSAHLAYFRLELAEPPLPAAADHRLTMSRDLLLRRMGNFLRDAFPSYGIYEVLGRLGAGEFAALTPVAEHASCGALLLRALKPESGAGAPALPLKVSVVHFDPDRPAAIDELMQQACCELLQEAASEADAPLAPVIPIASIGSAPRSDLTLA
jgi:GGDEF domain-containing protein